MIDIEHLDLNLLHVFRAVAEHGNVTRAGHRIGLSQSAASGALARLRQACADPLLVRSGGGMQLTPYGQQLLDATNEAFGVIRNALTRQADFSPDSTSATFTLLMSDAGAAHWLPIFAKRSSSIAPGLRFRVIELRSSAYVRQLEESEADLICAHLTDPKPYLRQLKLFSTDFVCIHRAGHPLIGETITPEVFRQLDFVVARRSGQGGPDVEMLARLGLEDRIRLTVPHFTAMPGAVAVSDLVMIASRSFAEHCHWVPDLRFLPLPHRLPPATISLYWHEKKHKDVANRWLRSFLQSCFRDGAIENSGAASAASA